MLNPNDSAVYEFNEFRIDAGKRLLWNGGAEPVALTPKIFDTLLYLVKNAFAGKDGDLIKHDVNSAAIELEGLMAEGKIPRCLRLSNLKLGGSFVSTLVISMLINERVWHRLVS